MCFLCEYETIIVIYTPLPLPLLASKLAIHEFSNCVMYRHHSHPSTTAHSFHHAECGHYLHETYLEITVGGQLMLLDAVKGHK